MSTHNLLSHGYLLSYYQTDHEEERRPLDALDELRAMIARAWTAAKLKRIPLHECRHTYASLMIAAGTNPKALSVLMGHASITITLDRYGHLLPGSEQEAGGLLEAYLARTERGPSVALG